MATIDLFLFRHGETDWNRAQRWQGQTDIPLNELGRLQARALIPTLQGLGLDAIFTSDLVRARETAEIVCKAISLRLHPHTGLREQLYGEAEGLTLEDIEVKYGTTARVRSRSMLEPDLDFRFPMAESKRELRDRVKLALTAICDTHPDMTRLGISTHGGVIRSLLQCTKHVFLEPVAVANGSVVHLEFHCRSAEFDLVAKLK